MARRIKSRVTVLAAAALAVATVAPPGAGAAVAGSPASRFDRLPVGSATTYVPASARNDRQVKVIVELGPKSVGQRVADAVELGRSLSTAQRKALRAQVRSGQVPLTAVVASVGGTVLASYQDAINGIAASVRPQDVAKLRAAPNVVAVHPVRLMKRETLAGVPFIGADQAWQNGTGLTGAGVKIAIIDTGIDYTHADFGGTGTPEAFQANDPTVIEAGTFPTAKVVGGFDFVGDDYAAESTDPAKNIPKPDADPLDCNGHGSHVAGIAGGDGVLADHSTYPGPYDSTTYNSQFSVGPGVAPQATLYAYKVFGCAGSVDNSIVIAAMNRALIDQVDVVNMSLGSPFGTADDPEVQTVNTLAKAGVTVVASAGNAGGSAYVTGAPASADRAISVAAIDASRATVPGAHATFSTGGTVDLQDSNEAPIPAGPLTVKVLRNPDGTVSLGCNPAEYAGTTGMLVVTVRGTCARAARAVFGQQAGSAAVVMINSDQSYPPMEGKITENPDTGEKVDVTIPFFGARGTPEVATTLVAADGGTVTLSPIEIGNPGYQNLASFTSGGPRNGDSAVKPDVTAPGVAILSAGVGTGFSPATISGTSQAAPFTAGTAALVVQAHPDWPVEAIKAAIVNTADPSLDKDYNPRLAGSGVVQAQRAVDTVGLAGARGGKVSLSFGAEQLTKGYRETLPMTLANSGATAITYAVAPSFSGDTLGATVTASPSTVTVPPRSLRTVRVTLALSAAAVAALPAAEASNFGGLVSIRGAVVATPAASGPGIYALRVPFLVAPRGLSNVTSSRPTTPRTEDGRTYTTTVAVKNSGIHSGTADLYAWGVSDAKDTATGYVDVRSAGVQTLPGAALGGTDTDRGLVFAVNMTGRWSNAATTEVDIPIDNTGDGKPDAYLIAADFGLVTAGAVDGRFAAFTVDADFNVIDAFAATAPMNGSTMLLPALASELGISGSASRFAYAIDAFDQLSADSDATEAASFDAFTPAVSTGEFFELAPGQSKTLTLQADLARALSSKARGFMIVSLDDAAGTAQAELIGPSMLR